MATENNKAIAKVGEVRPGDALPSIKEVFELAPVLLDSGYFTLSKKAEAVAKILLGRELGIGPVTSLQQIDVVKGRLRPRAQLIGALLKRSGRYDYRVKLLTDKEAIIDFLDRGAVVYESRWTMEDARRAKLLRPDSGWEMYPRDMLFARALSHGALKVCPEVLLGAEPLEVEGGYDVVEGEVTPEGTPPPAEWRTFWTATTDLGFNEAEVHKILGIASVKDWLAAGHSLEDGLAVLRHATANGLKAAPEVLAPLPAPVVMSPSPAPEPPPPERAQLKFATYGEVAVWAKNTFEVLPTQVLADFNIQRWQDFASIGKAVELIQAKYGKVKGG